MTGATAMPVDVRLPLDPRALVDLPAIERGEIFNRLDLDSWQRACVEQAVRLIAAGLYDRAATPNELAEHLRRERETREALQRPGRDGRQR